MRITEWLLERITEDEDIAEKQLAALAPDRTEYGISLAKGTGPLWTVTAASAGGQELGPRGSVEATPGRVLTESQAKREIIAAAWKDDEVIDSELGDCRDWPELEEEGWIPPALRWLATVYADRDGYLEEWKP